ncbi:MAG TPA: ABC transporter permease [Chitinophagaceae bacterium]|nr:ABC transporter permease [Chitinophagaceae bacterium]
MIARKLAGDASQDEANELEKLRSENHHINYYIEILSAWWNLAEREGKDEAEEAFERLLEKLELNERNRNSNKYFNYKKETAFREIKMNTLQSLINFSMFRNYFKAAWRNLQTQKGFTFINVLGLSVGIACCVLLLLYAGYELNFDKFHKNAANIYRPYGWDRLNGGNSPFGYTDVDGKSEATLGEAMKQELPDLVNYTSLQLPSEENLVRYESSVFRVKITYTDPSFFSVFTFPLKSGNTAIALHNLNDIVLTESRALQIFGNLDALGKIVEIKIGSDFQPFRVSAVTKEPPSNSTIQFDVLGNFQFAQVHQNEIMGPNWHPIVRQTYVQLRPQSKLAYDPKRLSAFIQKYDPDFVTRTKDYVASMKKAGINWNDTELPVSFRLQPLLSMHTDISFSAWGFTDFGKVDPKVIWILLSIAFGILLIACINFTTLAIGRSAGRAKEVGVRKVIGAGKGQVIFQFLTESFLLSVVSAGVGLSVVMLVLPAFNRLAGIRIDPSFLLDPKIFLLLIAVIIGAGFLAGSYPAFVLSTFRPIEVLKNKIRVGGSNLFTKSLVTLQFALSIALIIATVIILQQTRYLVNKTPGFDKQNVVVIDASQTDPNKTFPVFKQTALLTPGIVGVTSAIAGLGEGRDFLGFSDNRLSADINVIDTDYLKVLGMRLIAGENLRASSGNSLKPVIINETMMRYLGWIPQNAIGKEIENFQGRTVIVAGVVRNFNYRPLNEKIRNQVFETSLDKGYKYFYVRIDPGDPKKVLVALQKVWSGVAPGVPMKYSFLDDDVNNYYRSEQTWSSIVAWAGGISIFLASLGLFGLAALVVVNRTKETGIRKVLGASVADIVALLSKGFIRLIVIAFLIASPVAYYFMDRWLETYANRISINYWIFGGAGAGVILVSLLVISFHAIKAAVANPVNSLRSE